MSRQEMSPKSRTLDPARTVSDLKELRALTGDANGAQRVAFTETWATGREVAAREAPDAPGGDP